MRDGLITSTRVVLTGEDASEGSLVTVGASALTLVATILLFLFRPGFALPVLGGFLLVTAVGWRAHQAEIVRMLTLVATVLTVITVAFITYFLFASAFPAIEEHGLGLLTVPVQNGEIRWFFWLESILPTADSFWNPSSGAFSLIPAIWATVGIFGALFIAEIASDRIREIVKPAVEVLAGIPSIVYGFIGFAVLNSFVQDAFLDDGASFFIAGLVVGIMALPTVVSVAEDALSSVPDSMSDGSVAMGATEWQTMKSISIPAAFSGISAAVILGLGRAIGETMAVAAIMAAGTGFPKPLYDVFGQGVTLTSRIATSYGDASDSTLEVLFVAGVMLFAIVATMSVIAQYIERRMQEKLKGQS